MAYRLLPRFDPNAQHVVVKPMCVSGVQLAKGDPLPPDLPIRRVRQLYDTRKVSLAVTQPAASPIAAPKKKVKDGLR